MLVFVYKNEKFYIVYLTFIKFYWEDNLLSDN